MYAQPKFGNVTLDELNMTEYKNDTSAVALILLKKGETRFIYSDLYGFQFEFTVQTKIKILKNEGLDFCNQSISYYQENNSSGEKITDLNGTTYNLEGGKITKTKLSKDLISDEDTEGKLKLKKFALPAAKAGSVIEFQYRIVSNYFRDLRDFNFQSTAPILYTSFKIVIPDYFHYSTNMQGYEPIKTIRKPVNESFHVSYRDRDGRAQIHNETCSADESTFIGENIPAIKNEPYLWTLKDYITKVSFELKSIKFPWALVQNYSSSWSNIDKELLDYDSFGGNLKKAGWFKDEINNGAVSLERAKEIQDLIKSKVKWNNIDRLYSSNLKNALKNGLGSSADMNFLLINALKAGGFDAFPVVLSSRNNGRLPMANPSIVSLNNTITGIKIDTVYYYTDASARYGDWNILPWDCMVPQARAVGAKNLEWIDLTKISYGNYLKNIQVQISEAGAVYTIANAARGNSAYDLKSNYFNHKDQQDYIEKLATRLTGKIDNFTIEGLNNQSDDVNISYTLTKDCTYGDEYIYFNPIPDKQFSENPFKAEQRKFPVNFDYPEIYNQIINIDIPEGYIVEELPQSVKYTFGEQNDLTFLFRSVSNEKQIMIQYQLQIKNLLILPSEYEALRELFSKIVMKNSEQVVLKKQQK